MRSDAREAAFKIIYSEQFSGDATAAFKRSVYGGTYTKNDKNEKLTLGEEDMAFAERLVALVGKHREELNALFTEKIERFSEHRIYKIDKAIMLVALAEILYCQDVPPVVSVSEAAALARKYSTENSAGFVNGVLGGFINS